MWIVFSLKHMEKNDRKIQLRSQEIEQISMAQKEHMFNEHWTVEMETKFSLSNQWFWSRTTLTTETTVQLEGDAISFSQHLKLHKKYGSRPASLIIT